MELAAAASVHDTFIRLGISLGLGLLVGLQRERAESRLGGIRTFPLIALGGSICALLSAEFGGWVIGAGFIAIAASIVAANVLKFRDPDAQPGQTTEVAVLLMFGVGGYVMIGSIGAAVVVGAVCAVLLHYKDPLHAFARGLGEQDARAIMQFVLISLVILPVLPNQNYGPGRFDVFNPRKIWLMVVLIVGISLAGYVAYKLFGKHAGTFLGGILGGMISSTATAVSYARRAKENAAGAPLAAVVILIASTVAFVRVIVEIGAVAPAQFRKLAPPVMAMLVVMVILSLGAYALSRQKADALPEQGNPAELKSALIFAALYALVLFAVAVAKHYFGNRGLYVVGIISGLTDMDAITLSTAQLVNQGGVDHRTGWRVIVLASLANLVFKGATVIAISSRELGRRIAVLFGIAVCAGFGVIFLWPG